MGNRKEILPPSLDRVGEIKQGLEGLHAIYKYLIAESFPQNETTNQEPLSDASLGTLWGVDSRSSAIIQEERDAGGQTFEEVLAAEETRLALGLYYRGLDIKTLKKVTNSETHSSRYDQLLGTKPDLETPQARRFLGLTEQVIFLGTAERASALCEQRMEAVARSEELTNEIGLVATKLEPTRRTPEALLAREVAIGKSWILSRQISEVKRKEQALPDNPITEIWERINKKVDKVVYTPDSSIEDALAAVSPLAAAQLIALGGSQELTEPLLHSSGVAQHLLQEAEKDDKDPRKALRGIFGLRDHQICQQNLRRIRAIAGRRHSLRDILADHMSAFEVGGKTQNAVAVNGETQGPKILRGSPYSEALWLFAPDTLAIHEMSVPRKTKLELLKRLRKDLTINKHKPLSEEERKKAARALVMLSAWYAGSAEKLSLIEPPTNETTTPAETWVQYAHTRDTHFHEKMKGVLVQGLANMMSAHDAGFYEGKFVWRKNNEGLEAINSEGLNEAIITGLTVLFENTPRVEEQEITDARDLSSRDAVIQETTTQLISAMQAQLDYQTARNGEVWQVNPTFIEALCLLNTYTHGKFKDYVTDLAADIGISIPRLATISSGGRAPFIHANTQNFADSERAKQDPVNTANKQTVDRARGQLARTLTPEEIDSGQKKLLPYSTAYKETMNVLRESLPKELHSKYYSKLFYNWAEAVMKIAHGGHYETMRYDLDNWFMIISDSLPSGPILETLGDDVQPAKISYVKGGYQLYFSEQGSVALAQLRKLIEEGYPNAQDLFGHALRATEDIGKEESGVKGEERKEKKGDSDNGGNDDGKSENEE